MEISPTLEKKVRARIVKDRRDLKNLIDEHKSKKRDIESRLRVDPKSLNDESLRERIQSLEKLRANLLRLISIKGETYSQLLKEADDLRLDQLNREVEQENRRHLESANSLLAQGLKGFSANVKDIVEKINRYKEDYDKRSTRFPGDS